jgi:hypothetical protein
VNERDSVHDPTYSLLLPSPSPLPLRMLSISSISCKPFRFVSFLINVTIIELRKLQLLYFTYSILYLMTYDNTGDVEGVTVRIDTGVYEGATISMHYDPMIAKLCTHASSR